jgi:chromosomal replication initiation ATPase DnaA
MARLVYTSLMSRTGDVPYEGIPALGGVLKGEELYARRLFRREDQPELHRAALTPATVAEAVAIATGIHVADIRGPARSRALTAARGLFAHIGKRHGMIPFVQSARYLDREESAVAKLAGRVEVSLESSRELKECLEIAVRRLRRLEP